MQQVAQLLEPSVKNAIATLLLSPKATLKNSGWVPMCGAQYRGGKDLLMRLLYKNNNGKAFISFMTE